MNLYDATVPVFTKQLHNVERWLDKVLAYASAKKIEPEVLLQSRLYPDQWPFLRQITAACDWTKYCASKLAGKESPANPDTERTVEELRARVKTAIEYLATFKSDDFLAAEDRPCTHAWMQGHMVRGGDYLDHVALPNIHFHLTTAYSILRHNGVEMGKSDYLGEIPFRK